MKKLIILILALITPISSAYGWDGAKTGTISMIDVETTGSNYGLRVQLNGETSMCGTSASWAYVNVDAGNYDATASAFMLAYSTGKTVSIYSNIDSGGTYCKIGYVVLRPSP
ncbi:MAG: hypothetical protein ABJN65_00990 [Parasphingorhabdus sp.]